MNYYVIFAIVFVWNIKNHVESYESAINPILQLCHVDGNSDEGNRQNTEATLTPQPNDDHSSVENSNTACRKKYGNTDEDLHVETGNGAVVEAVSTSSSKSESVDMNEILDLLRDEETSTPKSESVDMNEILNLLQDEETSPSKSESVDMNEILDLLQDAETIKENSEWGQEVESFGGSTPLLPSINDDSDEEANDILNAIVVETDVEVTEKLILEATTSKSGKRGSLNHEGKLASRSSRNGKKIGPTGEKIVDRPSTSSNGENIACSTSRPVLEEIPICCGSCGIYFRFYANYMKHVKDEHEDLKPYSCAYCDQSYERKCMYDSHFIREHIGKMDPYAKNRLIPVLCDICGMHFKGLSAFEKHASRIHRGIKMIECGLCERKFSYKITAVYHMRTSHYDEMPLVCNFCKQIFGRSDILERHIQQCEMDAKNQNEVLTRRKATTCWDCGEHFNTPTHLQSHRKRKHKSIHTMNVVFTCRYCQKCITGLRKFQYHGKVHHRGKPMFSCDQCDAEFIHRSSLRCHEDLKHGNAENILCPHCMKRYRGKRAFDIHTTFCKRKSDNEKKLPAHYCKICKLSYHMPKTSFSVHMSRHKEYDFCEVCKSGFNRRENPGGLAEHMKVRHSTYR